ncbi:Phosphatidylglycerophosphatase C [Marinomonas spartinae]|uniref:Phosphatidylglycerophosphatase C n=1 Tax=Marinomonas spartinae TaxID=1792290 RepID=A0A1A8TPE0_9GAMM|nr:HAD-IB family phosphatase [Marinomonas spartinae]SBS35176.1 Phosphatidylglycerophosphatase C [Marinomonas spartinae]
MNLVLFDFDKTIVNRDTGAAYMKFMLCRNPLRLLFCFLSLPIFIPFLFHAKSKCIGFSVLLWLATLGISVRKIIHLRESFIRMYLNDNSTIIFKDAVQQLLLHSSNADEVIVVSGASEWMVKAIFAQKSLPKVKFVCSEETRFFGGMISKFHCYSSRKVKRVRELFDLGKYDSIIGYSDSSADIPILKLCNKRYIVNPTPTCFKKFTRSFNKEMAVLNWA